MKKNIVIIFLTCIAINFFADDQLFFQQAQHKFVEEKWEESLADYQKIENKNSLVWQNIATCFYNLQQYPQALVALKRASIEPSFWQMGRLDDLEKKIDSELHIQAPSKFYLVTKKIVYSIPLVALQIVFLIILIQIFFMLLRRWRWHDFTYQEKKFVKKLIMILFVCTSLWYVKTLFFLDDKAIVIKPDAMVYAGPDESFHSFEKLQPGIEVKVIKKQNNMYHVETQTSQGWVKADVLETVISHE